MLCGFLTYLFTCFFAVINFSTSITAQAESLYERKFLSDVKRAANRTHGAKEVKNLVNALKENDSAAGTEVAVLVIVVVVVLSVIGMVVYFVRKFDQLNRALPSYRYSSLKTDVNGVYGPEDKVESQVLVSVSTEEEDDDDEEDEDYVSPPTLLVRSQTVMSNGSVAVVASHKSPVSGDGSTRSLDSDDELLQ